VSRWVPASVLVAAAALAAAAPAPASLIKSGGVSYVTKTVNVKPHHFVRELVACPKHTQVLGGGAASHGGFQTDVIQQTYPADLKDKDRTPDDGWGVVVEDTGDKATGASVTAVCGKTKALQYVKVKEQVTASQVDDEYDVDCPTGQFAYSGGVSASATRALKLESDFIDPVSNGRWVAYFQTSKDLTATSYAVCGAVEPMYAVVTLNNVPTGARNGANVECPAGTRVYGGGISTSGAYPYVKNNSLEPKPPTQGGSGSFAGFMDDTATSEVFMTITAICGPKLN
jgi:hypothetical protein